MTANARPIDFGLMLNSTEMVRVVFAVPCPVLSSSDRGHQAGMLKRNQKDFFKNFYVVAAIFPNIKGRL